MIPPPFSLVIEYGKYCLCNPGDVKIAETGRIVQNFSEPKQGLCTECFSNYPVSPTFWGRFDREYAPFIAVAARADRYVRAMRNAVSTRIIIVMGDLFPRR